ncbi:hypothetical protein ACHAC9_17800 [Massilia sp. CMS3.1]
MTSIRHASVPTIEFWFEFGSNYSYLAALRIAALAHEAGIALAAGPQA